MGPEGQEEICDVIIQGACVSKNYSTIDNQRNGLEAQTKKGSPHTFINRHCDWLIKKIKL